jgi:hypothetical protein
MVRTEFIQPMFWVVERCPSTRRHHLVGVGMEIDECIIHALDTARYPSRRAKPESRLQQFLEASSGD